MDGRRSMWVCVHPIQEGGTKPPSILHWLARSPAAAAASALVVEACGNSRSAWNGLGPGLTNRLDPIHQWTTPHYLILSTQGRSSVVESVDDDPLAVAPSISDACNLLLMKEARTGTAGASILLRTAGIQLGRTATHLDLIVNKRNGRGPAAWLGRRVNQCIPPALKSSTPSLYHPTTHIIPTNRARGHGDANTKPGGRRRRLRLGVGRRPAVDGVQAAVAGAAGVGQPGGLRR